MNQEITEYIENYLKSCEYKVTKIPFDCKVWETQESFLVVAGKKITIHVSPYSEGYMGKSKCIVVKNMVEHV